MDELDSNGNMVAIMAQLTLVAMAIGMTLLYMESRNTKRK